MIVATQSDMRVVAFAATLSEAITEFRRHTRDITLMDQRLSGTIGIDTLIAVRGEYPLARIIMLTTSDGDLVIQLAIRAGAVAYLLKALRNRRSERPFEPYTRASGIFRPTLPSDWHSISLTMNLLRVR
jgi:DNA-binding NarL/FixJ family response regulator